MLETPTRTTYYFTAPAPSIIQSVFAKVATSGTASKPVFELVRVLLDQSCNNGWFTVQSANGAQWYCHREDLRQLFPIFGGV